MLTTPETADCTTERQKMTNKLAYKNSHLTLGRLALTLHLESVEIAQARKYELGESAEEVVHFVALELDFDTARKVGPNPTTNRSPTTQNGDAVAGVSTTTPITLAAESAERSDTAKQPLLVANGLLLERVQYDLVKLN